MLRGPTETAARRLRALRQRRAEDFARKYFRGCTAHRVEAIAVHRTLEFLCRRNLDDVNGDSSVLEILGEPVDSLSRWFTTDREPADDSQGVISLHLAQQTPEKAVPGPGLVGHWTQFVFRSLLGPVAKRSTWEMDTIWTRSIIGVINERVRWDGPCTCSCETPSNTRLQRTSG